MRLAKRLYYAAGATTGVVALSMALLPGAAFAEEDILAGEPIQAGKVMNVSDVAWSSVSTGYGKSAMRDYRNLGNADLNKYQMEVAGQTFEKGVGLHVPAELVLATNGLCSQFLSYVGIDDSGTANGGSFYANWVLTGTRTDGTTQELAQIETRKGEIAPLIDVDISGIETLTIQARQLEGGNNGGSFADLGYATLNCTEDPIAFEPRVYSGSQTNLEHLTPGAEVEFLIYDAQPNSDIDVKLNDEHMVTVKAVDSGPTSVKFAYPTDNPATKANFVVDMVDRVGGLHSSELTGTVIIPRTGDYYVDCDAESNGSGAENSPFNSIDAINEIRQFDAGSRILFKKGVTCAGRLLITGNGSADSRNIIGAYGEGSERPILNAEGGVNAIEILDGSYWTITGLQLMNPAELGTQPTERQGIMVRSTTTVPKAGIVIDNNVIGDVAGWPNKTGNNPSYRNSGGIVVMADHDLPGPNPGLTDGITITNNEITNVGGGGIKLQGDGQQKLGKFHENVYIADNNIHQVGGDAIVVHASDHALIQNNRAIDLGQGKYAFQAGNFAGIWGMTSKELLFRYNVVGNSTDTSYDSTAWDCDWGMEGESCIFEYNYSYNNAGGAYLDCISGCGNGATDTRGVVRFNIMQDDCRFGGASGGPAHTWIYNNTFYCPTRTFVDHMAGPRTMFNNIIVAKEAGWDARLNSDSQRVYSNNAYFGGVRPPASETDPLVDIDPQLFAPGSSKDEFNVDGYQLLDSSPLLGAGVDLDGFSGEDIFGNPTGTAMNIGAYTGNGVPGAPLTWEQARNTTSIAHESNLRTGGVEFTEQNSPELGRGRDSYLGEALSLRPGEEVTLGDFHFTWDPVKAGTPDSVKATGQSIAIDRGGEELHFIGFSAGDSRGGTATVTYEDGTTQLVTMELPNWHETTGEAVTVAEANEYNSHSGSYLGSVSTKTGPSRVYGRTVALEKTNLKVSSVTLPSGSPVIGEGLTLFAMGVSGDMTTEPETGSDDPTLAIEPGVVTSGGIIKVNGSNWPGGASVTLNLSLLETSSRAATVQLGSMTANDAGEIGGELTLPDAVKPGKYLVTASSVGIEQTASATLEVRAATIEPTEPPTVPGPGEGSPQPTAPENGGEFDGLAATGAEVTRVLVLVAALGVGAAAILGARRKMQER